MAKLIKWVKSFFIKTEVRPKKIIYKFKRGDKVDCKYGIGIIFSKSDKLTDKTKPAYFILSESNDPLTYFDCDEYEENLSLIEIYEG